MISAEGIEDIYPLSPMQQGMLFHSLDDSLPGAYCEQVVCDIRGAFDRAALRAAWQGVIDSHAILRSAFVWDDLDEPQQVVLSTAELPIRDEDWQQLDAAEQHQRMTNLLDDERRRGFAFERPPLLRLIVIRLAEDSHRFVVTYHHALLDGWSLSIVMREVHARYRRGVDHEPTRRPPRPYRDYIAWLAQQPGDGAEAYFRNALADFRVATRLGLARSPGSWCALEGVHGECRRLLGAAATDALHGLARQHHVTLNTVLQGAWALLLGRYSGETDIVFGSVVSGRPADLAGVDEMVGLFINTLPLRARIAPEADLATWLSELQTQNLAMRQHEHTPLASIHACSAVPRGRPLFESVLIFENYPEDVERCLEEQSGGAWVMAVRALQITNYPIHLAITPGEQFALHVSYDRRRFSAEAMERLLGNLVHLLNDMATQPRARLKELSVVCAEERERVLVEWNRTAGDFPLDQCFHQLFETVAGRTPDAVAVVAGDGELRYGELNRRANRLAHALVARSIGADRIVAVLAPRGAALLSAVLGVLKAGGAYLPLDPSHPADRHLDILKRSRCRLVLTTEALVRHVRAVTGAMPQAARPDVVTLEELVVQAEETDPPTRTTPHHLAYVIFTSGSTGQPKGAMIEHRGMLNHLMAKVTSLGMTAADRLAQTASQCFDISVWQMLAPLLVGGQVRVIDDDAIHDPEQLLCRVGSAGITVLELVPSLLRLVLEAVERRHHPLPALRWLVATGEALPPRLCRLWLATYPHVPMVNAYGPTECSDDVAQHVVAAPPAETVSVVPIGRPIANTTLYVLDEALQPLPIGAVGELYVGGCGVGRGYLNDPELTSQSFRPDPYCASPGGRLYRTGDQARALPDGNFEFLGRLDGQVKLRGFRIELGEIEEVLSHCSGVRQAVAVVRDDGAGGPQLCAYLVGDASTPPVEELRRLLAQRLPDYLVPSAIVALDALPLTANGKLDRSALPVPTWHADRADDYAPARGPVEAFLCRTWSELLGVERVGIHDNFFTLGGDSILSIQMVARARQAGILVTARQVFEQQTIAGLAEVARMAVQTEEVAEPEEAPLAPAQHWLLEQGLPEPQHYNMGVLLSAQQTLAAEIVERAIHGLLGHHDGLRLRLTADGTSWRQHVAAREDHEVFRRVDVSMLTSAEQDAVIQRSAATLQGSLDLIEGPVMQAAWFDAGARPGRLLLIVHHLAVDGVSWRILVEDLCRLCEQLGRGDAPSLPPRSSSYRHWAHRLAAHARTPEVAAEAAYWLATTPVAALPRDLPGGENREGSARDVTVWLGTDETTRLLQEAPRAYRAHVQDLLLAALVETMGQWTGERSLRITLESHGREELFDDCDVSRTVGWFTSMYPVLLERPPQGEAAVVRSVKAALRLVPRGGTSYGLLRYLCDDDSLARELRAVPDPELSFNYFGRFDQLLGEHRLFALDSAPTGPARGPDGLRRHVLDVNCGIFDGRLQVIWTYSDALHQHATIAALARTFLSVLESLLHSAWTHADEACAPSDFPLAALDDDGLAQVSAMILDLDQLPDDPVGSEEDPCARN